MKYFLFVLLLIALGVVALFVIKKSVLFLLVAIVAIIVGYFFAVRTIAREE